MRHYRSDGYNHLFARGQLTFRGAYTGNALGDLLLGLPSLTLLADNDNPQALRTTAFNLFAQDDWRPASSLTVNAGLRYELNTAAGRRGRSHAHLRSRDRHAACRSGENGVPRSGVQHRPQQPRAARRRELAARRTRADLTAARRLRRSSTTAARSSRTRRSTSTRRTSICRSSFPVGQPLAARGSVSRGPRLPAAAVGQHACSPTSAPPSQAQGSLGLEARRARRRLGARYVGSHGEHLVRSRNINQPAPGPGPLGSAPADRGLRRHPARRASGLFRRTTRCSCAPSGSMRAGCRCARPTRGPSPSTMRRRFCRATGTTTRRSRAATPRAERGLSDFDVRHRLSTAVVWVLPDRATRWWARDWQVSAILAVAVRAAVHAARRLRQQQHRQRRRIVRLRPAERGRSCSRARRTPCATAAARS